MIRIYAAKQVGQLSYFVDDLTVLYCILDDEMIIHSKHKEFNPRTNKEDYYVSLSRSMTAAPKRNKKRWKYGVIIDGDQLSEHYHIEPYSFAGNSFEHTKSFRVKYLVSYDDNTYALSLVNWPTIKIDRSAFESIKELILSQPDEFNRSHKLIYQDGGKRRVNGHLIDEKFTYDVQHGDSGQLLSNGNLPDSVRGQLIKGPSTNEFEERVWTGKYSYVDLKGCIQGIVVPRSEFRNVNESNNDIMEDILNLLDTNYTSYDVIYY